MGFRGLEFRGLGFRGFGFRGLGFRGFGFCRLRFLIKLSNTKKGCLSVSEVKVDSGRSIAGNASSKAQGT